MHWGEEGGRKGKGGEGVRGGGEEGRGEGVMLRRSKGNGITKGEEMSAGGKVDWVIYLTRVLVHYV